MAESASIVELAKLVLGNAGPLKPGTHSAAPAAPLAPAKPAPAPKSGGSKPAAAAPAPKAPAPAPAAGGGGASPAPLGEAPRLRRGPLPKVLLPVPGARNVLITSALPYVNNVPHLGNIIGCVLSADVYARYARARGWNALYVCGTDEYGTATETKAMEEGLTPRAICDKYHVLHREIYEWFDISFDHFGRTSAEDPWAQPDWPQTRICQEIFKGCVAQGNVISDSVEQVYCVTCARFLADRFIEGECPLCHYEDARGDQCDKCGKLLSATELLKPVCKAGRAATAASGAPPHAVEVRSSQHLFLDLPKLTARLEAWIEKSAAEGAWSDNSLQVTRAWLRDGLKPRAITRDLKWGTPVPYPGMESKVFYVWFDAPIGYLSITASYTGDERWRQWWQAPPPGADVRLYQFMGKDNIPFHTVIFPASLLGSGDPWTMLHHVSTTEYLNYETGKFSKSRGVGVFGDNAKDTGIPSEVWRYYLLANRPEAHDTTFSWDDFAGKTNNELLKNPGNLVNRALALAHSAFGGHVPPVGAPHGAAEAALVERVNARLADYHAAMEGVHFLQGVRIAMALSGEGNLYMQEQKPWELAKADPPRCATVINTIASLIRVVAAVMEPFMPGFADKVCFQLGLPHMAMPHAFAPGAATIPATTEKGHPIDKPRPIFAAIPPEDVARFRERFAGAQEVAAPAAAVGGGGGGGAPAPAPAAKGKGGKGAAPPPKAPKVDLSGLPDVARVDLRVGKILRAWPHEKADKLWCEEVDVGEEKPRMIASGLRAYYKQGEMEGRLICVVREAARAARRMPPHLTPYAHTVPPHPLQVCNLKPRAMMGFTSEGMVLCAANADRTVVEFVAPPIGSVVGERLLVPGKIPEGAPFPVPEVVSSKEPNAWSSVAKELRTDERRVACFAGVPLTTSTGVCAAPTLAGAPIS